MRSPFRLVVLVGLTGGATVGHAQTPPRATPAAAALRKCALDYRADQAKNPGLAEYHCFESENGWFLALDTVWARETIPKVRDAVKRFEKTFGGKPVPRGLFKQVPPKGAPRPKNIGGLPPSFKAAGAQWDWPWGVDQEDSYHLHEMAHRWIEWVYTWTVRDSALVKRAKYGGPAHDWLDESAPIYMEMGYPDRTAFYHKTLKEGYQAGKVFPLERLLTMHHPLAGASFMGTGGVGSASEGGLFYAQCRGFIDFLLEQTKDSTVLGALAANEAEGWTVAEWLPANGARYKLPTTMAGLEAAWQTWLKEWAARSESATP